MINFTKLICVACLLLLIFACQSEQEARKSSEKKLQPVSKGEIRISLDSLTGTPYFHTQLFLEKELIVLNSKINALQFYEFKDRGKMTKRLKFEKEGAEGVGSISKFLVHNPDSIFLLNAYQYKIYLTNSQGKILEKYSLLNRKVGDNTALPDPFPISKMIYEGGNLYICSLPDANPYTYKFYEGNRSLIKLNIKSKEYSYIYGYPKAYKKSLYPANLSFSYIAFVPELQSFVHSFAASNDIQVTDIDHQQSKEYYAGSILFEKIKPLIEPIPNDTDRNLEGKKRPKFVTVLHSPYKKMIIRTVDTAYLGEDNRRQKQKGSMIFLDYQFNKIGEVICEEDMFLPNMHFTKEGIYIFKKSDNENEMIYELFEVSIK